MSETVVGILGLLVLLAVFLSGLELGLSMAVIGFLGYCFIVSMKAG